jgi:hypothetical protein
MYVLLPSRLSLAQYINKPGSVEAFDRQRKSQVPPRKQ